MTLCLKMHNWDRYIGRSAHTWSSSSSLMRIVSGWVGCSSGLLLSVLSQLPKSKPFLHFCFYLSAWPSWWCPRCRSWPPFRPDQSNRRSFSSSSFAKTNLHLWPEKWSCPCGDLSWRGDFFVPFPLTTNKNDIYEHKCPSQLVCSSHS